MENVKKLINVEPKKCLIPSCLLNISVSFDHKIHNSLNAVSYDKTIFESDYKMKILCRIGNIESEAQKVGDGWILCHAPAKIQAKDIYAEVSIGGEVWSDSSEQLELVSTKPNLLIPLGALSFLLIVGILYYVSNNKRIKTVNSVNQSLQKISYK